MPAIRALLDGHDDAALAALMTNLGGHDLEALLEAFHGVAGRPAALLHRLHRQGLGPAAGRATRTTMPG